MTRTFVDGVETVACGECRGHGYYLCGECGQETTECDVCHGVGEVLKGEPKESTDED